MSKFIESCDISQYEVLTDIGWVDIKKSHKTIEYKKYSIVLCDGNLLKCADDHILISYDNKKIMAKDSLNHIIKTKNGNSRVVDVIEYNEKENMYDLELPYHHMYYTNDILSHNTTTVAAYLLHLALFNDDYTIAILANKKSQAAEILDRIKTMYMELPWWLQPGIKRWNVQDIVLANGKKGTTLFTESTQGTSIRGKSVNCLDGDTVVTIQHKETKEEFEINLSLLYEVMCEKESR